MEKKNKSQKNKAQSPQKFPKKASFSQIRSCGSSFLFFSFLLMHFAKHLFFIFFVPKEKEKEKGKPRW